jgi:hypothetical protein
LKNLHQQGYTIRTAKQTDEGYLVTVTGKRQRSTYNRNIMMRRHPSPYYPQRRYGPSPSLVGMTFDNTTMATSKAFQNYLKRRRERKDAILRKQNTQMFREENNGKVRFVSDVGSEPGKGGEHTINMKMRAEREASKRAEHTRILKEHEQAERQRRELTHVRNVSFLPHRKETEPAHEIRKTSPIDLTEAREAHVTGES